MYNQLTAGLSPRKSRQEEHSPETIVFASATFQQELLEKKEQFYEGQRGLLLQIQKARRPRFRKKGLAA